MSTSFAGMVAKPGGELNHDGRSLPCPGGTGNLPVPLGYQPNGRPRAACFTNGAFPPQRASFRFGRQVADRDGQVARATRGRIPTPALTSPWRKYSR
jgi:hypothetical protein